MYDDIDCTPLRGVVHRVLQQLVQHPPQAARIGQDDRHIPGGCTGSIAQTEMKGETSGRILSRALLCNGKGLTCEAGYINGGTFDPDRVCLQLRDLQKAPGNLLEAITLCHNR